MATEIRDYAKLAADIREAVGPENIISAANCATRPRLVLKETPPRRRSHSKSPRCPPSSR